jgi:hypothetical protein
MALNLNFGPTNEALKRMSFLLGQDWLGKQSQKRRFDYLGEQEAMYGRLGDASLQRQLEKMTQGFDIDKQLTLYETMLKIAQDPTADRIRKKASVLREAGQPEAAAEYDRQFAELIQGFAEEAKQVVKGGQVNWEGVFNITGVDKGRDLMQKWQKDKDLELGFAELGEKEATRLGKEGVGAKSQKSYYEHIKGLGNQAITYIKGLDVAEFEGQAGALTQKTKGNVLSMLRKLVARSKSGRLNREQELFLRDAMNIDKLKQMVSPEGEPIGFPGQAGSERGKEFMAETDMRIGIDEQLQGVMPSPTTEPPAPPQLPPAPGADLGAGYEEKIQRLVTLILAEAQRQGKEITPVEAEEMARRAVRR